MNVQAVDDPTHDISPFGIKHMAGNGEEFTRTNNDGYEIDEATHPLQPETSVALRGRDWDDDDPLTYLQMNLYATTTEFGWGAEYESTSARSFRVVLEIPGTEK
jgi:hypothetical protein